MVYVGEFTENDLAMKKDKEAVAKAMKETGLKYTRTEFVKKRGKIVGMKIWVCGANDIEI